MSRALLKLKKALRRRYLRWGRSVSRNLATHRRVVRPDYPFPFKNKSRPSTPNKPLPFFLSLSLGHRHTLTGHPISGSSRRSLQLQEVRALCLSPKHKQDLRKVQRPRAELKHQRVGSPLPLFHCPHAPAAPAVPIWVQMSGLVSGRITMFVHLFCCRSSYVVDFLPRKKSSADGAGTSTKG
jgi:hypothetical protein